MTEEADKQYTQFSRPDQKMGIKVYDRTNPQDPGKILVKAIYNMIQPPTDGACAVVLGKKNGFVDLKGKELFPLTDRVEFFGEMQEGKAAFLRKNLWGFIDRKGREIIAAEFTSANSFSNGLAVVCNKQNLYGAIDEKGKSVIPFRYPFLFDFSADGYAVFGDLNSEVWGIVDQHGKEVFPQKLAGVEFLPGSKAKVSEKLENGDFRQGILDLKAGSVEWNNNLDKLNEHNRLYKKISTAYETLIERVYKSSCVCAYPRIRYLLELCHDVVFPDSEIFFQLLEKHLKPLEPKDNESSDVQALNCKHCGSEYQLSYMEFNAFHSVRRVQIKKSKTLKEIGAKVKKPFPVALGFRRLEHMTIPSLEEIVIEVDPKKIVDYLSELS